MPLPLLVPAIIAGASAIAGGIMNLFGQSDTNKTNRQIASDANAANQQLQAQQNQWNLEQWQRQNDYNSPTAQRDRLEKAGLNPFMSTTAIAQSNNSTQNLTSAPYTPTVTPSYTSPVSTLSQPLQNSANDFISTYNNIRMSNAQVDKVQADADVARANANAITGYRKDLALSESERNIYSAQLAKSQTELNKVNQSIVSVYGSDKAAADLAQSVQQTLESQSRTINNEFEAKRIVASTVEAYSRSRNLNVNSKQVESITNLLVQKMKLETNSLKITNDMNSTKSSLLKEFGRSKEELGVQGLIHDVNRKESDASIRHKEDEFYCWKQGLDYSTKIMGIVGGVVPSKGVSKAIGKASSK